MTDLREHVLGQWRLSLIQKHIVCPVSGDVLDIDTARFILDPDGDPHLPLAPHVADSIAAAIERGEPALKPGYTLETPRER